ncbi:MAG: dTDP-4-dehydrorhamnose reductase [Actinobacteria bacterium]|nr:dTDP-4-dehydrorhamnose reductase [Actinomycetota bacterium]
MKVLVAGAGGMLGHDFVVAATNAGHDVVGFDRTRMDVSDVEAVRRQIDRERPDMVVNCAAWTDVDGAEEAEDRAFAVNGTGAGNIAAAAREVGAAVVYVSTDYVFDGEKGSPYVESDQPAPQSAYARTKLAGEEATAAANPRHFIVRSSGLFGINGKNFVATMLRLGESMNEVTVVRDQVTSPTYTWHLAYGLTRLIDGIEYGIHHMAAAGECSWYEFAAEVFEQGKVDCRVLSITSEMFGQAARRPAYSVMQSQREHAIRLPSWHDGLAGYLAQREAEVNQ